MVKGRSQRIVADDRGQCNLFSLKGRKESGSGSVSWDRIPILSSTAIQVTGSESYPTKLTHYQESLCVPVTQSASREAPFEAIMKPPWNLMQGYSGCRIARRSSSFAPRS